MRYGFVTCVELGKSCLEELISLGHDPDVLITLEDQCAVEKSGRTFLDSTAAATGAPLIKIRNVNETEVIDAVHRHNLDWLFIIGWSQIAGDRLLSAPSRGVVGIHPTLLPRGRGRAAIPWAILKQLRHTGVTMFELDSGIDTGPIISQIEIPIDYLETATTLYNKVNRAHRTLIRLGVERLNDPLFEPTPQDERRASLWPARTPRDGQLSENLTTAEALRLIRATTHPYPGAFSDTAVACQRVRVWSAQIDPSPQSLPITCDDGVIYATDYTTEPLPKRDLSGATLK